MKKTQRMMVLSAVVVAMMLGGCAKVRQELGVGRHSPDEFTVVKRAPLTLPPDYGLRAPHDGRSAPESAAIAQAKTTILGAPDAGVTEAGSADGILLQKTGAVAADPDIRNVISRENGYLALQNRSVADRLLNWSDDDLTDAKIDSSVVDAQKERERVQRAIEEGKSVDAEDVPVIEKKSSTIDKIF